MQTSALWRSISELINYEIFHVPGAGSKTESLHRMVAMLEIKPCKQQNYLNQCELWHHHAAGFRPYEGVWKLGFSSGMKPRLELGGLEFRVGLVICGGGFQTLRLMMDCVSTQTAIICTSSLRKPQTVSGEGICGPSHTRGDLCRCTPTSDCCVCNSKPEDLTSAMDHATLKYPPGRCGIDVKSIKEPLGSASKPQVALTLHS